MKLYVSLSLFSIALHAYRYRAQLVGFVPTNGCNALLVRTFCLEDTRHTHVLLRVVLILRHSVAFTFGFGFNR